MHIQRLGYVLMLDGLSGLHEETCRQIGSMLSQPWSRPSAWEPHDSANTSRRMARRHSSPASTHRLPLEGGFGAPQRAKAATIAAWPAWPAWPSIARRRGLLSCGRQLATLVPISVLTSGIDIPAAFHHAQFPRLLVVIPNRCVCIASGPSLQGALRLLTTLAKARSYRDCLLVRALDLEVPCESRPWILPSQPYARKVWQSTFLQRFW